MKVNFTSLYNFYLSTDINKFVRLQAEVPLGVVEDVLYHLFCIQAGTGLEEMPGCFQTGVFRQVLSCIDHFDLIYMCQPQGKPFRGTGHPVDAFRQRVCPVSLDANIFSDRKSVV